MNGLIPAIDVTPDSPFIPAMADGWSLPQSPNSYSSTLTAKEITLLIAGFLALAGLSPTVAQLEADAATYSCLAANQQIAAVIYQLTQVLDNLALAYGGGMVYAANYNGVAPAFTPPSTGAIAIDTGTLEVWVFVNNMWN